MEQRVLSELTFDPKGERYAFAVPQLTEGVGAIPVQIATITRDSFVCPECGSILSTLTYFFEAQIRLTQRLWCHCGGGEAVPCESGIEGAMIYRNTLDGRIEVCLAGLRRLIGRDMVVISMRLRTGQVEASGPAGVSGVRFADDGSRVYCWRCVLLADSDDWQDDRDASHGFAAADGGDSVWGLHCPACRISWQRNAPDEEWELMRPIWE